MGKRRIGELLVEAGAVTPDDVRAALGAQKASPAPPRLGEVLVEMGRTSAAEVGRALAAQFDLPFVELTDIPASVSALIPVDFQALHKLVPFRLEVDGKTERLHVAIADPAELEIVDELRFQLGRPVRVHVASAADIESILAALREDTKFAAIDVIDADSTEVLVEAEPEGSPPAPESGAGAVVATSPAALGALAAAPPIEPSRRQDALLTAAPFISAPAANGPPVLTPSGSGPKPQPQSGSGPKPQPQSGSGPKPQPQSGSGPNPVPKQAAGSGPKPQPQPTPANSSGPAANPLAADAGAASSAPPAATSKASPPQRPPSAPPPQSKPPAQAVPSHAAARPELFAEPAPPKQAMPTQGAELEVLRELTEEDLRVLEQLDRLANGQETAAESIKVMPTQLIASLIRLLMRKGVIREAEFLDELSRK